MQTPHIYISTGGYSDTDLIGTLYLFAASLDTFNGYSDTDLIGTLYPFGTDKPDFFDNLQPAL